MAVNNGLALQEASVARNQMFVSALDGKND